MALNDDLRRAAADCLDIARTSVDPDARTRLLALAQKFMELSEGGLASHVVLSRLLDEFNDAQMLKQ